MSELFDNPGFMPHIHCYLNKTGLVWTMLITDLFIGIAYVGISLTLWSMVRKIKLAFSPVILCFGLFIGACGATHFMEVWTLWNPTYWLSASVKIVTAVASVGTGIYLFHLKHPLIKIAHAAKTSEQRRIELETLTGTLEARVKERTKELEASENRYRTLLESLPQLVWSCLPNGDCNYLSQQWVNYTGTEASLQLGKVWLEKFIHPLDYPLFQKDWQTASQKIEPFEVEFRILRFDGNYRWFKTRALPIKKGNGQIGSWIGTCTDIETEKRNELALIETKQQFESIANNIPQLAWMTDAKGFIFWYNQNWYDYTGTTLSEMQGWGWKAVHHEDHAERVMIKWRSHLDSGEPWEDTFPLRSKNGEWRWFLSRAKVTRNELGEAVHWLGTNTDITEQLKIKNDLQQANRAKDELLSICSHELRTPVTSMKISTQTFLRSLEKDPAHTLSPERIRKLVDLTDRQLDRLTRLIEEMLDFSRIHENKLVVTPTPFDFVDLLRETAQSLEEQLREAGCELKMSYPHSLKGQWDHFRLQQVLINLLSNAMKYGDAKPIEVKLSQDGTQSLQLSIRDHGIGISKLDLGRIFQPYERAVSGNHISGLGLGLFISSRIVEAHGGSIEVQSTPGIGSTFTVNLPIGDARA